MQFFSVTDATGDDITGVLWALPTLRLILSDLVRRIELGLMCYLKVKYAIDRNQNQGHSLTQK
ncbi:hypothetical protein [Aerosakkonema funiforme]|uniref:Uncharacterized protein n=1 Tax=Aerosakkonema funiforme FACHB-1375 TaxID=2949571 RepID=A0A926ZJZ1_9CYAN|nr:hypothetical protein [Aerosakkonema funiforme]MBD2183501.1 hypothetical protein [Aerosakkonema funiforme FACHB-1375]